MSPSQGLGRPRPGDTSSSQRPTTAAEARAAVEAQRAANRTARAATMEQRYGEGIPGRWILVASWASTVLFTALTVPAAIDPERFVAAFFAVSVVLFFAGCAIFAAVLVLAAARSREDAMGIGGLFFLAGSAPRTVQLHLLGSLAAQVVVGVTGAAVRPFSPLAFGTLVPTLALALCGLWAVRHGLFAPAAPDR